MFFSSRNSKKANDEFAHKKLELCLMVVSLLIKIKFGYAQISVPKISIPMLKTACLNPWIKS